MAFPGIGRLDGVPRELRHLLVRGEAALRALRGLASREDAMRIRWNQLAGRFQLASLPGPLAHKIWVMRDGVVWIQYTAWSPQRAGAFQAVLSDMTVDRWCTEIWALPGPSGDYSVASFIRGPGTIEFINSSMGPVHHEFLRAQPLLFADSRLSDVERFALEDFRITFLGTIASAGTPSKPSSAVASLRKMRQEFLSLIDANPLEEAVQVYIERNPLLLGPGLLIPKQRLGEDFVTDFVLGTPSGIGTEYALIEIERPEHRLFTQSGDPSAALRHAEKQTVDWEVWLNKNISYIEKKLDGFRLPARYRVIIGRQKDLTSENADVLRIMNDRMGGRAIIQTYDDLLSAFDELIASLDRATNATSAP